MSIRMPDDIREWLREESRKRDVTMAWLIVSMLREFKGKENVRGRQRQE